MGCSQSSPPTAQKMQFKRSSTGHNFGDKSNLNKEDFIFTKRGEEVLLKVPRDIDGQQFIVEECEGSDVFLLDHMAALTIDVCKRCNVITGPVASSVFIRDCEDCIVVIACQQLRLRDCKNMTIFLHSTTGPIIESSSNISFGCYNYGYFGFEANLLSAEMSVWENEWYSVYDFTPASTNFKLLPSGDPSTNIDKLIPASSKLKEDGLSLGPSEPRITPLLYGPQNACGKSILYILQPRHETIFRNLLESYVQRVSGDEDDMNRNKLVVLRTTKRKVTPSQFATLLGGKSELNRFLKESAMKEPFVIVACELSYAKSENEEEGEKYASKLEEDFSSSSDSLKGFKEPAKGKYLRWTKSDADQKSDMIFEHWRVKT